MKNPKTIPVWLKLDDDTRFHLTMKTTLSQVKKTLLKILKLTSTIVVIDNPKLLISPAISRTTAWRKRKNPPTGSVGKEKEQERKAYTCNKCQQPMTTNNGYSQFRGQLYCPNTETLTKQKWLEVKKNKKNK